MYLQNLVLSIEFEGTSLDAPKKRPHPGLVRRSQFHEGDPSKSKDAVRIQVSNFDDPEDEYLIGRNSSHTLYVSVADLSENRNGLESL